MGKLRTAILASICIGTFFNSCSRKDEPDVPLGPVYEVPSVYSFSNVSYTKPLVLISMIERIGAEAAKGNTKGVVVSSGKLKNMINNKAAPFGDAALDGSGYTVAAYTEPFDLSYLFDICDSLETASKSLTNGSAGKAGVVQSTTDISQKYLFNERGLEYREVLEKGLLGALIYYQIVGIYFASDKTGDAVENATVTPGVGTTLQHNWDEMFGYFGVPGDYPLNKTKLHYLGKYGDELDALNGNCARNVMEAFIKGRAGINNKDLKAKNDTKEIIKTELEKILVSTAIHNLNQALANFSDDAIRNHSLSISLGLIKALKYNPESKLPQSQYNEALKLLGSDFYKTPLSNIYQVRSILSYAFGYGSVQDVL